MTTRTSHKVGASNIQPSAVTPTASPEVTASGPAHPAAAGVGVPAPAVLLSPELLAVALRACERALAPILAALLPSLITILPQDRNRHGKVSASKESAVSMVARLLRKHPDLSVDTTADGLDADMANVGALTALTEAFTGANVPVGDTRRLLMAAVWHRADVVYNTARTRAKRDQTMATDIAAIRDVLARGPRTRTSAIAAVTQQQKAAVATTRATKATQNAAVATARAASTRPKQPRHSPVPVPAHGTSPVPLANPQGPAASADVAPQGPAPGR